MNLEFGILWFEDAFNPGEKDQIREAALNSGFEVNIRNSVDGTDLDELAREQSIYHPFDLILLDLNLADGVKGDTLAPQIRQSFRSTPLLFYSGSLEEPDLRRRMADDCIEGIFCAHRRRFIDRASEMIADLAQSLDRLSGMRGLAMEVVTTADALCKEIILNLESRGYADGERDRILQDVLKSAESLNNTFPKLETLAEQLDHRAVDSMRIFDIFRKLLKVAIRKQDDTLLKDELSALQAATRTYREDVIGKRNILGHAREIRTTAGWEIRNLEGECIMTTHDFPELRRNFLSNLTAIRKIHQILIS